VQSHPPENWLARVWERYFPNTAFPDRKVSTTSQPPGYQRFRRLGFGSAGPVDLAYQSAECPKNATSGQNHQSDDLFDLDALIIRFEQAVEWEEQRPRKVPGIRRVAERNAPVVHNCAKLLARKTYAMRASSPSENTEYRLLNRLSHVNIIKLVDYGVTTEGFLAGYSKLLRISLLTESGIANLKTVARKAQPLPVRDIAHLMKGVLAGVKYLHDHRIIHRDLKPENVVLMPDMTTKLIDLGSAIEYCDGVEQIENRFAGTPRYTAPEIMACGRRQLLTFEQLQKADYWGIGCILYELATGEQLLHKLAIENINDCLNERIAVVAPEGWNEKDVLDIRECLGELLKLDSKQRQTTRLEAFLIALQ